MTKKRVPTQEMIDDLSRMGDKDYVEKWGVSRIVPIKLRRRYGIKSFTPQHGTKRKIIDGVEHKWCPIENGHWETLDKFRVVKKRAGGLAGICIEHENKSKREYYRTQKGKEWHNQWKKTENGKKCLRNTWRKRKAIKDNAYIKWSREDEEQAYEIFGGRCAYCSADVPFLKIEFDHFVPIALGGKTEPKNMVPCCKKCNHGTGGKFKREPKEWMIERFGDRWIWIYRDIEEKIKEIVDDQ